MANKVGNKRVKVETEAAPRAARVLPRHLRVAGVLDGSEGGRARDAPWTLYVRGPHGEDPSYSLSKVEFHLHQSFPQPVRT